MELTRSKVSIELMPNHLHLIFNSSFVTISHYHIINFDGINWNASHFNGAVDNTFCMQMLIQILGISMWPPLPHHIHYFNASLNHLLNGNIDLVVHSPDIPNGLKNGDAWCYRKNCDNNSVRLVVVQFSKFNVYNSFRKCDWLHAKR